MNQNIKNIVITGGSGYIGGHIAKHLYHTKQYRLFNIDIASPTSNQLKYYDLSFRADYDSTTTYEFLKHADIDGIIHCAGDRSVGESVINPAKYYTNNVAKTANFLSNLIELPKIPVVLFSSSASVYGKPTTNIITEDTTTDPISPYGRSKYFIENMLKDFDQAYGLKYICFRYFNACGADLDAEMGQAQNAPHIIAKALESIINKSQFTLNGNDFVTYDGTCIRDYVHVIDIANAHHKGLQYLLSGLSSDVFNLGTNTGISNQEIINFINSNINTLNLVIGNRRPGDPDKLIADCTKAQQILEWRAEHSDIQTIVNSAWKWYNNGV